MDIFGYNPGKLRKKLKIVRRNLRKSLEKTHSERHPYIYLKWPNQLAILT
ncbi:hypothetical protein SAMN05444062_1055 [Pseudomonas syringae]|nr:hypothetical protein SAMN05444062_1055 [Pseudomonas syringae]